MKTKILVLLVLAFAMMLVLTGCGSDNTVETQTEVKNNTKGASSNTTNVVVSENALTYTLSGKTLTVKVKAEGLDYDKAPWVGICPVGTYVDEEAADEVDVTYTYVSDENYPNIELNIDEIEKGEWLIVFCDSDDEGNILATTPITIK